MAIQFPPRFGKIIMLCLLSMSLVGCSSNEEQRIISPYKPFRDIQACLSKDSNSSRGLFRETVNKLADWLQDDITINQDSLLFTANLLTAAQDPAIGTVSNIAIPAFSDDPKLTDDPNPYANADAHTAWQKALREQHARLKSVQRQLQPALAALRQLDPPVTQPNPASLAGCLGVAHLRFAAVPDAQHILIYAGVLYPFPTFDPSFLLGAHVIVVRSCPNGVLDCLDQQTWVDRFRAIGASSVIIVDAAAHLQSPF